MFIPFVSNEVTPLGALVRYFAFVISEGDWLNDWLTHMPPHVADAAQVIGQYIAPYFGG